MSQDEESTTGRGKVVELSDRDMQDARRLLSFLIAPEGPLETSASNDPACSPHAPVRKANAILSDRRRRIDAFGSAMFGEPAWDMLLLLFVADSGQRQTIGRLANLAGITKSTALRWLEYLERQQLTRRQDHPTDRRAVFVELTPKGRTSLEAYLSEIRFSG